MWAELHAYNATQIISKEDHACHSPLLRPLPSPLNPPGSRLPLLQCFRMPCPYSLPTGPNRLKPCRLRAYLSRTTPSDSYCLSPRGLKLRERRSFECFFTTRFPLTDAAPGRWLKVSHGSVTGIGVPNRSPPSEDSDESSSSAAAGATALVCG